MAKAIQPMVGQSLLFMPAPLTKESFADVKNDARLVKAEQLPFLVNWLREAPELFIDYETATDGQPFILGAFSPDKGARIVDFRFLAEVDCRAAVKDGLSARTRAQRTVAFNIGYEVMISERMGFTLGGTPWDPSAAAYAVNETREPWGDFGPHTQKALCFHELKKQPKFALMCKEWLKAQTGQDSKYYECIPASLIIPYNGEDLELGWELHKHLEKQVVRNEQTALVTTDSELGAVLERVHRRGICFSKSRAIELIDSITEKRKAASQRIIEALDGRAIDVLKDNQLFGLVFGEWKLPHHDERIGVDGDVLEWLIAGLTAQHSQAGARFGSAAMPELQRLKNQIDVLDATIDLREYDKMKGTYLLPWTYEWSKDSGEGYRIILPHLNSIGPRTRRFSANNPNLQNVPTRTELGQIVRSVFVSRPGWTTYSMDESQAEYRTMAHYANAKGIIEAYLKDVGIDFHQIVSDMMGVKRKIGKNLNFGKLYGMGIPKLMISLQCSEQRAREIDTKYNRMIPELPRHRKELELFVKQHGYVRDEFGGRRHIPAVHAHIAINTEQQMTVADLLRAAMVRADPIIRSAGGHMLLQVHDEILFELPGVGAEAEEAHKPTLRLVKAEAMENYPQFRVPFKSDCNKWAPDWAHEQEVKLAA